MATGPLPAVPATIRCTCLFGIGADTAAITRFFITYTGSAPTAGQLNTFAAAIGTAFGAHLASLMDNDSELLDVTCEDLSTNTSPSGTAAPAISGTRGAAELDGAACMVIGYEQARRYRGGHARGYWRLGVQGDLSGPQTWDSTFLGLVETGIGAFVSAVVAAGWAGAGSLTQSQVSYFEGFTVVINPETGRARNVPNKRAAAVINTITAFAPRARVGSQRRRN